MLVYKVDSPWQPMDRKKLVDKVAGFIEDCRRAYGLQLQADNEGGLTVVLSSEQGQTEDGFYLRFTLDEGKVYIANLQVPAGVRRQGIGACCVRWLQDTARELGLGSVYLESYPEAVAFWKKLGFTPAVREEEF